MKLILASNSPRRKEILTREGYSFEVYPSDIDEKLDDKASVYDNVKRLAFEKANDVFKKFPDCQVLGSDTVVYLDKIYGKPHSKEEAHQMLRTFSGKTHEVITGVAVINPENVENFCVRSFVTFKELTDEEIDEYIETGEPMDKAGAYAIQGIAAKFITNFDGSYDNIVGLPIAEIKQFIK